jgi:ABC-type transport system involved in multi-copper enzyme maturation permease subunit
MAMRLGPGPVFVFEWLTRSRRWQGYALRGLFVLALLAGLGLIWRSTYQQNQYLTTRQQMVQAGESFFFTMTITQLALVLLAAPAATAGAICLDKARGTLAHVMVTELTDGEVVLGKLGARLVPVLNLIACALPVSALGTLLGGIDPMELSASLLIACGLAFLGCTLALALSVWMSRAHEVMLVVFAVWILWLMALPVCYMSTPGNWAPRWLEVTNPFWLSLAPSDVPGETSMLEPIGFLLACLVASAGLAALSVWKVRAVYLHQAGRKPKPVKDSRVAAWYRRQVRWWPGPSLDRNPVLWREWHRNRPSKATRIVWLFFIALTSLFSLKMIWDYQYNRTGAGPESAALLNAFQVTIGLLLVSASAGTVLSEERVRGSLDVLISTPLTTRSIVWGKWWGSFRKVPWLAFWPTLVAFAVLPPKPPEWMVVLLYLTPALIVAQGATLAGLGLAMATWISRTGRAVTWTISALIASVIGWPVIGFMLFGNDGGGRQAIQLAIVLGSPFYNSAMSTVVMEERTRGAMQNDMETGIYYGMIAWTIAYALLALGLFLATLLTFDRCLGRTPDRPGQPGPRAEPKRRIARAVKKPRSEAWVGELN